MNIKNRLRHISHAVNLGRRYGKTTLIARAAKELDGIVLSANFREAKRIEHAHQVTSKSYETNLSGLNGPFFIDHDALSQLLEKAALKIEALEKEIEDLGGRSNQK